MLKSACATNATEALIENIRPMMKISRTCVDRPQVTVLSPRGARRLVAIRQALLNCWGIVKTSCCQRLRSRGALAGSSTVATAG